MPRREIKKGDLKSDEDLFLEEEEGPGLKEESEKEEVSGSYDELYASDEDDEV
ncbi:MAG: hypothetical protein JSW08_02720 [archaeon]|nr:MAG: hypothetical protein JSW08_02720 [archaeon]